jgi:hypothetical protein
MNSIGSILTAEIEMLEMCDVPGIGSWNHAVLSMNCKTCKRNVISILPTQLPH